MLFGGYLFEDYWLLTIWTTVAGVEQNRYKTNNGCIKHLPQTGLINYKAMLHEAIVFATCNAMQCTDMTQDY